MSFLLLIARAFINTFGITQPRPESERRAAYFIGVLLVLIVFAMVGALGGICIYPSLGATPLYKLDAYSHCCVPRNVMGMISEAWRPIEKR